MLGLTLLEGRLLDDARRARRPTSNPSSSIARGRGASFRTASAVGKRFREGGCTTCPWTTVVGVVSEVKYVGLDKPDEGTVYTPLSRRSLARVSDRAHRVRCRRRSCRPVRQAVRELDPGVAADRASRRSTSWSTHRSSGRSRCRCSSRAFAVVALVLSIVGIYGVMTYYVQQHSKDISIRLALGGSHGDVLGLILGQGMKVVAGGVAIGVVAALMLTRLMSSLLFGVGAADAPTYAARLAAAADRRARSPAPCRPAARWDCSRRSCCGTSDGKFKVPSAKFKRASASPLAMICCTFTSRIPYSSAPGSLARSGGCTGSRTGSSASSTPSCGRSRSSTA